MSETWIKSHLPRTRWLWCRVKINHHMVMDLEERRFPLCQNRLNKLSRNRRLNVSKRISSARVRVGENAKIGLCFFSAKIGQSQAYLASRDEWAERKRRMGALLSQPEADFSIVTWKHFKFHLLEEQLCSPCNTFSLSEEHGREKELDSYGFSVSVLASSSVFSRRQFFTLFSLANRVFRQQVETLRQKN